MVNLGGVGKVGDNDQNAMYKIFKELIKVLSKQRKYSQNWVQHVKDIKCFFIFMCRAHFAGNGPLLILCTQTHIHTPHTQNCQADNGLIFMDIN